MTDAATLPDVSVIICCRNSDTTLAGTLDAVAGQAYPGWWEVLVVDNGSDDGTVALAESYATRLPRLRVLRNPKPGFQASALNYGMREARSDVFVFLDSDDVVEPDYVLHMARALRTAPYVGARMDIGMLNPVQVHERRRPLQQTGIDLFSGFRPAVVGAAMGARREAIEKVDGFDEALPTQHDLDISWRLLDEGIPATFVPDALLHYRYRTSAREIFGQERSYGEGEVLLYRKFRGAGMRRRSPVRVVATYLRTLAAVLGAFSPGGRARLATLLGKSVGRLQGSLRSRTAYL